MLRMVICCGGGMSSSVISVQIKKAIEDKGWEDEISVAFMPLLFLVKHQEEFDIAMLCPHTMHHAQEMARKNEIQLPMYVIPARLYGSMNLEYLREDAEDILKIYAETKENPLHFPGEKISGGQAKYLPSPLDQKASAGSAGLTLSIVQSHKKNGSLSDMQSVRCCHDFLKSEAFSCVAICSERASFFYTDLFLSLIMLLQNVSASSRLRYFSVYTG